MSWHSSVLDMRPIATQREVRLLVLLAIAVAIGMAVFGGARLGATSLWLDETFSVVDATRSWSDLLSMRTERGTSVHPPLYSVILRGAIGVCGTGETCVRLPSLLGAAGSCALMVMLAGRMFGWVAAITAAWLWPTLPYLLKYADQARGYTLILLLASLAMVCAGRSLGYWGSERWRRPATWGLAACLAALIAMHLLAASFIVPFAAALVVLSRFSDERATKEILRAGLFSAILALPVLAIVVLALNDPSSSLSSSSGAAQGLRRLTHALFSLSEYTWTIPALLAAAIALTPGRRRGVVALGLLVASLPLVPLLVRAPKHFIVLRYFFPSVALVGLMATAGIAAIAAAPGRLPKSWTARVPPLALVLVGLAGAVVPCRTLGQRHAKKLEKRSRATSFEPWDEASAWIAARVDEDAIVVPVPHRILWPPLQVYPPGAAVVDDDPDALLDDLRDQQPSVVFVVSSHISTAERRRALNAVRRTLGRGRYRPGRREVFGRQAIAVREYVRR